MAVNFNALLEDIKSTNWQDAGTWHAAPKALVLLAALVVIPVAGYFADTAGQIEALEAGQNEESRLKEQYLTKKRQAINLDLHRQQLREINVQFGALLRQLPDKSQMDALLVDINQAGLGRGLQFELFKPGGDTVREFYAELPISVKVVGTYHDMGAFASDIGQLSRIVTLNDVAISTQKDGNLAMDATARTFRYLSDDEVNAQRKAAAPKAKPAAVKAAPSGGH
ncbi:MAG: type pilus assembly protein PilO [Betaproteobacteria bacterium]|jgi:type IV pilus assembly protein PilO|nr:type pilus assembly protein PilO [Betaproteobacteria bacterium]